MALAAVLCLMLTGTARPSYACECVARTQEEYFNNADAVFTGRVVGIDRLDGKSDEDYLVTFNISQHWKGLSEEDRYVAARLNSLDGNVCGYPFSEGKEYLTYAVENGGQLSVGGCHGTSPIAGVDDTVPSDSVTPDTNQGSVPPPRDEVIVEYGIDPASALLLAAVIGLSASLAVVIIRKPKR